MQTEKQRERLVELLDKAFLECDDNYGRPCTEQVADYLMSNNVVVFPCKVGDKAWFVFTPRFPANPSDKGKWFMVEDGVQRLIYGAKVVSIETWNIGTISAREIGKKFFFTKEEAEKALNERMLEEKAK